MARALIVEDDPLIARLMREILIDAGHEVDWVADGLAVCPAALGFRPDVILLDLGLPSRSGLQVLDDLREVPELSDIPVLVVTAWWSPEVRQVVIKAGAAEALAKPFGSTDLVRSVQAVLAGERAVAEDSGEPVSSPTH